MDLLRSRFWVIVGRAWRSLEKRAFLNRCQSSVHLYCHWRLCGFDRGCVWWFRLYLYISKSWLAWCSKRFKRWQSRNWSPKSHSHHDKHTSKPITAVLLFIHSGVALGSGTKASESEASESEAATRLLEIKSATSFSIQVTRLISLVWAKLALLTVFLTIGSIIHSICFGESPFWLPERKRNLCSENSPFLCSAWSSGQICRRSGMNMLMSCYTLLALGIDLWLYFLQGSRIKEAHYVRPCE